MIKSIIVRRPIIMSGRKKQPVHRVVMTEGKRNIVHQLKKQTPIISDFSGESILMNFLNLVFYAFIVLFLIAYFIVPAQYKYMVIFLGSYYFYGYANPKILITLIIATVVSYLGGIAIQKYRKKKLLYVLLFSAEILIFVFYKYTDFIINNINHVLEKINSSASLSVHFDLIMPIGLSFIIFQTCTYLSDIYRGRISVEKNIVRYGAFAAFFPTVLSGPIQKARNLLPQIKNSGPFEYEDAKKGVILFVWGLFEKIMVANKLMQISSNVIGDYLNYSSAEILIAAVSFSLYIYADFSSYSDMARGISKIMRINIGKNFNNPYLSVSTSEFWNRWHISLNEWFIEIVYIPLGGNRKGTFRKYINMMVVFGISGLWHGANWHFVAWGIINGLFAIIGQIIKPVKSKIYDAFKIDESAESIVFIRRLIVFVLITLTWVFFRAGIIDSLRICKRIVMFDVVSLFDPNLLNIGGTAVATFVIFIVTVFFCFIQYKRQNEYAQYEKYARQPFIIQCFIVALIVCVCIFGTCTTDANVDTRFLYFQF